MIRCIVIDDEPLALALVNEYISKVSFLELAGIYTDAIEAKKKLDTEKIDLLFLDIQMPDINGIEFYDSLINKPMVIFTTAFTEFAVEGFNVNAIDYLLKPFEYDRFLKAAYKANEYFEFSKSQDIQMTSIFVKSDYQLVKINLRDIQFIEGLDDYIRIHLPNDKTLLTLMSLKAIFEKLPQEEFVRLHRSYIVPLSKIEKVSSKKISIAGKDIPVGTSFAEEFFKRMEKRIS